MRFFAIIACTAAAPILVAASEPVRLQPSSPWDVQYAENSCRLLRTFGDGEKKTTLEFESEAPGQMDLLVIGKALDDANFMETVFVTFLPIGVRRFEGKASYAVDTSTRVSAMLWSKVSLLPDDVTAKVEKDEVNKWRLSRSGARPRADNLAEVDALNALRYDFESKVTGLEISSHQSVILQTGPLTDAMKVFEKCVENSLRDWGIDPEIESKIVKPVWARNPSAWLRDAYPKAEMMRGAQSEVKARLLVDATGRPTKCTSLSHFRYPLFSTVVCGRLMQRAHFEPAELADGTKVPSYYMLRVAFRDY